MKFVLMSLVLVQTCLGMDMMLQKIVKQTEKHVLENSCFGPGNKQKFDLAIGESMEKCLQLAPTNDLLNVLSPNSQFSSLFPAVNVRNPFKQFQVLYFWKKTLCRSEKKHFEIHLDLSRS